MRIVSFKYLQEVMKLVRDTGTELSNKRLRRFAYLDIFQNNYTLYKLYNYYKKTVNSDAANNQLMVLLIVISIIVTLVVSFII